MQKSFATTGEMIADEMFLSWFYKENEEKIKAWETWVNENTSYQPMVAEAVKWMESLTVKEAPVSSSDAEAAYRQLAAKLDSETPIITMQPARRRRWWQVAAAAVLLIAAGIIYYTSVSPSKAVIETQYGQVSGQQLPDGSRIMLNANTIVTLSHGWQDGKDREVWLKKGEAFFQVKKTPYKNRFIVHTDQLDVIVTGTQFNVRTAGDKTSVLLTEGSVIIKTMDGKEMHMQPGDFVEINNHKAEKKTINQEIILAWKENRLNFDSTSIIEAATMISNHYGVTVKLADSNVSKKTITGMMPNDNLETLLKALELTNDFKITRTDNTILISQP